MNPQEALERLKQGNVHYVEGRFHGDHSDIRRKTTATNGQEPFAVIITCSDSRVPAELIFSAGVGDLFVIRTAGNVVGPFELGSVEYAVAHLHTKLVVVLGHVNCGAVGAALSEHKHNSYIDDIVKEVLEATGSEKNPETCVHKNANHSAKKIRACPALAEAEVVSAVYDIYTGKVVFDFEYPPLKDAEPHSSRV